MSDNKNEQQEAEIPEEFSVENMHEVEPPKKKKFGWVAPVLLLAAIALGIFMMFKVVYEMGDDVKSFDEVIAASDWRFAVVTLAVLTAIFLAMWLEYVVILKTTTGKCHFRAGMKVAFIGKFYDNVTPFATGGQPMQIYYLNKKGLTGGTSSAVIMIKYFAWMFCWIIISLSFMAGRIRAYSPRKTTQ